MPLEQAESKWFFIDIVADKPILWRNQKTNPTLFEETHVRSLLATHKDKVERISFGVCFELCILSNILYIGSADLDAFTFMMEFKQSLKIKFSLCSPVPCSCDIQNW